MFKLAAHYARRGTKRAFQLGAVGLRRDGATVHAYNGTAQARTPSAHAEARLARKLDHGSIVFVARVSRATGKYTMARPCEKCLLAMKHRGVSRVYYTIAPCEYGVIVL